MSKIGDGENGVGDYYDDEEEEGTSYRDEGEKDDSDDDEEEDDDNDEGDEEVLNDYENANETANQDEEDGNKENYDTPTTMKSDQNVSKDDLYGAYGAYEQNDGREKVIGVGESEADKGFVTTMGGTGEKVVGEVAQFSVLPLGHQLVIIEEMRLKKVEERLKIEKKKLGIAALDERKAYEARKERELKEKEKEMKDREEEKQREELKWKEEEIERDVMKGKKEKKGSDENKKKEEEVKHDKEKQEKIEYDKQEKDRQDKEKQQVKDREGKEKDEAMKAAGESDRNVPSLEVQKLFLGNIPEGKYGSLPEEDSFLDNEHTPDGEGVRGSAGNEVENAMLIVVDDDEASVKGNLSRRSSALNYFGGRDRSKSNISEKETEERLDHMFEFERLGSLKKVTEENNNDTEVSTDDSKTVGGKKKTFFGNLLKKLNPIRKKKQKTESN